MKVWRNSEGREFDLDGVCACVGDGLVWAGQMADLGYELVEKEPVEFERMAVRYEMPMGFSEAHASDFWGAIMSPRLIPGKIYVVREKV
jgi:hypothetical protein